MSTTPNIGLEILTEGQANKEGSITASHQQLDALVQGGVKDRDLATPPGSPVEGDLYLVAAAATGAWTGQDGNIAHYRNGTWTFLTPKEGWRIWVDDEDRFIIYNGTNWLTVGGVLEVQEDGGSVVAEASALNFTGSGVSVSDGGGGQANVTISGGSGLAGFQGIWEQIDRQEFSGVTSVIVGGAQTPEDYDAYFLFINLQASADAVLLVWASTDGGASKITNYVSFGHQMRSGGSVAGFGSESTTTLFGTPTIDADALNMPYCCELQLVSPGSSIHKMAFFRQFYNNDGQTDAAESQDRYALVENTGGVDSFVIEPSTATITGTAVLIGLKKSEMSGRLVEETGTSRTLSGDDNNRIIDFTTAGTGVTVTVPDSLPQGFACRIVNRTGGSMAVSAGGTLTIIGDTSMAQNQGTEIWMLTGTAALVSAL